MDNLQIYDFITNKFTAGSKIPFASGSGNACAHGGKILYCGGIKGSSTVSTCAMYTIATNKWGPAKNMPFGLNHAAYATLGNTCHIFSGRIGGNKVGPGREEYLTYNFMSN